jgi:hypothetical protein
MFCKRASDGVDWYKYIHEEDHFTEGSLICTVYNGTIMAVVSEVDRLFPQGATVIELIDAPSSTDPQKLYRGRVYDGATNSISVAPTS